MRENISDLTPALPFFLGRERVGCKGGLRGCKRSSVVKLKQIVQIKICDIFISRVEKKTISTLENLILI